MEPKGETMNNLDGEFIESFRRLCPANQEDVISRLDWILLAEAADQYGLPLETGPAQTAVGGTARFPTGVRAEHS
jgi:hypothetical protein